MTFNRNGNELTLTSEATDTVDNPEAGIWEFVVEKDEPIKLVKCKDAKYNFPKKVYGNTAEMGSIIIRRWRNREANTGVLCSGPQGVGKSLQAQWLINKGVTEHGAVVFVINKPIVDSKAFEFIRRTTKPAIVFIDEFEKIYSWEQQNKLLTYMDGGNISGVLWILTVNELRGVGSYYLHRPNRILFHLRYSNIPMDTVEEIVDSRLKKKKLKREVLQCISMFSIRTYDSILSYIDEVNQADVSPEEVLNYLNIEKSEQMKGGKGKVYYRIFAVGVDKETEEDITKEYAPLDRWCKQFDIFGEGTGGFQISPFTEVPLITSSKIYPNEPEFKLDGDKFVKDLDNFRIQRYLVGKTITEREVFLEFSKDPYPEPEKEKDVEIEPADTAAELKRRVASNNVGIGVGMPPVSHTLGTDFIRRHKPVF